MKKVFFVLAVGVLLCMASIAFAQMPTPSQYRCGTPHCYWETPMDITDEESLWAMLMQPAITLKGNQKTTMSILSEPREDAQAIGEVTCATQAVHLLETRSDGWSYIECYSSSFHGSKVKAWNKLVQGYVPTDLLVETKPATDFALVVDKLDQRLYIFEEGKLYDILKISTGKPTEKQPYNETVSGDFFSANFVGEITTNNGKASFAIRFNDTQLLHEEPRAVNRNGELVYRNTTADLLGSRASEGCIRVQRRRTPKGTNMAWLWRNLSNRTRLVIWEDSNGRSLPVPDDDTIVYYNKRLNTFYHAGDKCRGVAKKYGDLLPITYAMLEEEPFLNLKMCRYCVPPRRVDEITRINADHKEGLISIDP